MQPPFPSFTSTWHNDTYAAIDPTKPDLSQTGKTIIITGAGSGIGRQTALSFAKANASHIVLIGRTESTLSETATLITSTNPSTKATVHAASVTDSAAISSIAASVGTWDVLVLGAASISSPALVAQADLTAWWDNYEVNVKAVVQNVQAFLPTANPKRASLFTLAAGGFVFGAKATAYLSGYITSKVTQSKLTEYLAAENPNLFAVSVHPGMVDTKVFRSSGADPAKLPIDTERLPADFLVWLSQGEGEKVGFLNGKTVFANWDVDELEAKKAEIEGNEGLLTIGLGGWPFVGGN
ncbi:NAD(P)-binding protein [Periconia macrospinosa]|uniref:NAD(P)-binding protein n=1 Tax=Periconia macrospinosa TaxID=97972 RepID=A0A2V1DW91_9PLEO|nr:NAD(P)-binding protein [Periconia macrospinosa]